MDGVIEFLRDRGCNPRGEVPSGLSIDHVTDVSSDCGEGSIFVALKGLRVDGHTFLADAAQHGAKLALVSEMPSAVPESMTLIQVDDTRRALGPLAQSVAGEPSRSMDVVGVTGTNGKTTSVYLVEAILRAAGRKPGIISTIVNRWNDQEIISEETTPSAAKIAQRFAHMRDDGVDCVAMEVSSHAIEQRRTDGIRFRAMALTNLSQDHLDYHGTMEEYAAVKKSIFVRMREENPDAIAVINVEDEVGKEIASSFDPDHLITYGIRCPEADLLGEAILFRENSMRLMFNFRGRAFDVDTPLLCYFNALNCMTAAGLCLALGIEPEAIDQGCQAVHGVPGRFESVDAPPGIKVIVDYAHTPDALSQVLRNARGFARKRLIAVFGCGGDRDQSKRPLMGKIAAEFADEVIITNDNPRTEDPEQIASEIVAGMSSPDEKKSKRHRVILNRRSAIHFGIQNATDGDVVVIAGKGHEDYQIVGDRRLRFDDREVAREMIRGLTGQAAMVTQKLVVPKGKKQGAKQ